MAKTDVAKAKKTDVAVIDHSELLEDAEQGHGFVREDLAMPFIRVIQRNSPQLDKNDSQFIKGAEEGDFLNTATGEVVGKGEEGIYFCPSVYTVNYTEWKPRESGGGLVKDWGIDDSALKNATREKGKDILPNGNYVVTSALYYGHLIDKESGSWEQAILAAASTQLKKSRRLNAVIQNFRMTVKDKEGNPRVVSPRMWYHIFHITTVPESNEHGKWMGLKIERDSSCDDHDWGNALYAEGKMLNKLFEEGKVRAQAEHLDGGDEPVGGGGGGSRSSKDDDDIPF